MDEREKLAPVTEQHYSRSQRIDLMAEGMALWTKALLASYESERIKIRKKASVRLAAWSSSLESERFRAREWRLLHQLLFLDEDDAAVDRRSRLLP
jgi:G:T/U-mismatch repair DNA glycosylase